jgi:putative ABC transport system ATP-binding protein
MNEQASLAPPIPVIAAHHLRREYSLGGHAVKALDDVTFTVSAGEFVAIMGPSGSGKSTLMNLLGCLDTPTEGRYLLNGQDVAQMDDDQLAGIRNREIGFVFQSFHLLPRQTVLQNVMQPLVYRGMPHRERVQRATEALHKVGLGDRLSHRPNQLSGGQRQRVAVARALVGEPSILLADEPTGNLDSATSRDIMALFDALHAQGQTVIIVTHEPDIAAHCHRVLRVSDGRIVSDVRDARTAEVH